MERPIEDYNDKTWPIYVSLHYMKTKRTYRHDHEIEINREKNQIFRRTFNCSNYNII